MQISIGKFLKDDQVKLAMNCKRNNQPWAAETVGSCYQMLAKLGSSSYEFLRSLHWPLVSLRTLQERTSQIRFLPGHQHQFMDILGKKVAEDPLGQLAVMALDEMALKYM
jgi:Transposase protein